MPPKVVASQHGAQCGSNRKKIRNINDVLRKTRNKYNRIRSTKIKTVKVNKNLDSKVVVPNKSRPTSLEIRSSLTLAELAKLCKKKSNQVPKDHSRLSELGEGNLLIQASSNIANTYDPSGPDLHVRLWESNKRCEELMRKLEQQQIDFAMSVSKTTTTPPGVSTLKSNYEPINYYKQLDRMLRYMPSFNGKADENYDSYVIGVRQTLDAYAKGVSEEEKLSAIKVKIGGDAREVLASSGTILTVESLISTMNDTYGRDQRTTIADVKQKPEETVRMFANRLRMNLKLLGWVGVDDPNKPNIVSLEFFINGLLPSISSDVRKLCPRNLDVAVDYAIQLESQKDNPKISKSKINHLATDNDSLANLNRSIKDQIKDQLSALTAELKNAFNQSTNSNSTNPTSCNRSHTYSRNNSSYQDRRNNNGNTKRPFSGTCFGCKETGHSYLDCSKISGEKREDIRANFPAMVAEYRANRANSLNLKGVSTPSK